MKSPADNPPQQAPKEIQNDPSNWRWGIFYYNPKDKRIFPPKRIAFMGWTINFANPISILAFLVLLSIIGAIIWFLI